MKCNDCNCEITKENHVKSGRLDVCDPCYDTRFQLVTGKIPEALPGSEAFRKIQHKMAAGRGTAKKYIDSLHANQEMQI